MRPAPALRLLVFDWDGTLVDSVGAIVGCTRATMVELGLEPLPERAVKDMIGLGLRETVEVMCPGCDEALFHRVLETYRRLWIGEWRHRIRPFVGAEEVLTELARREYLLAVATAKTRPGLDRDFGVTRFGRYFHASRTVDEALSKPHPKMLLDLLEELGVRAEEALMIGDTVHDLQMAANADVPAVAVTSGAQPREVLEELRPAGCLRSVAELPAWLASAGVPAAAGRS